MDEKHLKLTLIKNASPKKTGRVRSAPKISPYCPVCGGNIWIRANKGLADYGENMQVRCRACVNCLSKGIVTTW